MTQKDKIDFNLYDVIRFPLQTEKTTRLSEVNQVTFVVACDSTKPQIKKAVELVYDVKVKAVNTVVQKGKTKRFRGREGQRSDIKKAFVTLEKNQIIEIASGV
jgi:large subunit ribosomal protein L23